MRATESELVGLVRVITALSQVEYSYQIKTVDGKKECKLLALNIGDENQTHVIAKGSLRDIINAAEAIRVHEWVRQ